MKSDSDMSVHCNVSGVGFVRSDSNRVSSWATGAEGGLGIGAKDEGIT